MNVKAEERERYISELSLVQVQLINLSALMSSKSRQKVVEEIRKGEIACAFETTLISYKC